MTALDTPAAGPGSSSGRPMTAGAATASRGPSLSIFQPSSLTWKASPSWIVSGKLCCVVWMAYLSISVA